MSRKSFVQRVWQERSKVVRWPFPVEGMAGAAPRLRLLVLAGGAMEAAHLGALDHFAGLKRKVTTDSDVFVTRERAEIVLRAVRVITVDAAGTEVEEPLADSADELADFLTLEQRTELFWAWKQFQLEVAPPIDAQEIERLIGELKKNSPGVQLDGLPSSWLIELVRGLASPPPSSTPASSPG